MGILDTAVAQAVARVRLLERALHDPGPWALEYAGQRFEAERTVCPTHVHLAAEIPEQCWLVEPDGFLYLVVDGEVVAAQQIEHPGDGGHRVDWMLGLSADAFCA